MINKERLVDLYKRLFEDYIDSLIEINGLEEINAEHQKLNGELREKIKELEEINKGKTIQELGMSDLYKED